MNYCVTKEGKAYEGNFKSDIIYQVCTFRLTKRNQLCITIKGYAEYKYHSYSDEYTQPEMHNSIIHFIWDKLEDFGFTKYKKY